MEDADYKQLCSNSADVVQALVSAIEDTAEGLEATAQVLQSMATKLGVSTEVMDAKLESMMVRSTALTNSGRMFMLLLREAVGRED